MQKIPLTPLQNEIVEFLKTGPKNNNEITEHLAHNGFPNIELSTTFTNTELLMNIGAIRRNQIKKMPRGLNVHGRSKRGSSLIKYSQVKSVQKWRTRGRMR